MYVYLYIAGNYIRKVATIYLGDEGEKIYDAAQAKAKKEGKKGKSISKVIIELLKEYNAK